MQTHSNQKNKKILIIRADKMRNKEFILNFCNIFFISFEKWQTFQIKFIQRIYSPIR